MARSSKKQKDPEFVLFDVVYEDGARLSNRKVPGDVALGLDGGDGPVRAFLEAQDRDIAEKSGRPRGRIKAISRSGK